MQCLSSSHKQELKYFQSVTIRYHILAVDPSKMTSYKDDIFYGDKKDTDKTNKFDVGKNAYSSTSGMPFPEMNTAKSRQHSEMTNDRFLKQTPASAVDQFFFRSLPFQKICPG